MTIAMEVAAPIHVRSAATLPDHLSWSSLRAFATCGKRYFWKYIEPVPEEFKASSLAFGGAFHSAVEAICAARLRGDPVPEIEAVLADYDSAWQRETAAGPQIQYCKGETDLTLRELASRMLAVYREYAINESTLPDPGVIIGIEEARRFRLLADVPPIESRLDLLELQGDDLIVSDLKTSRSRYSEAKVRESLGQLILYATSLVGLAKELGAKRIVPQFIVVSKGKNPALQVLRPQANQDDVSRLKQFSVETNGVRDLGTDSSRSLFETRRLVLCSVPYRGRCLGH